jgi:hypothetical protein
VKKRPTPAPGAAAFFRRAADWASASLDWTLWLRRAAVHTVNGRPATPDEAAAIDRAFDHFERGFRELQDAFDAAFDELKDVR